MEWRHAVVLGSMSVLAVSGCGSDTSAVCVSNRVGNVCADSPNGGITFSGQGLSPGSEVRMTGPEDETFVLQVGPDGSFEPGSGHVGFLASVVDTEFTFAVAGTDANGDALTGDIVVSTR